MIDPSSSATKSTVAGEATISSSAAREGGGLDDESWGVSRSKASTSSSSTSVTARTVTVTPGRGRARAAAGRRSGRWGG